MFILLVYHVDAMRGCWLGMLGAIACGLPPAPTADATDATSSSSGSATSTSATTTGSASTGPLPGTFGMDAPVDEGSEAGFVPPLDLACAGPPGTSPHCALCDVRAQECLDDFRCVPWAEDG